jgi:hypothetical protein
MHVSSRNPVLLGLVAAAVAVLATAISGGNVDVAYTAMFLAGGGALFYGLWPELRNGIRHRR